MCSDRFDRFLPLAGVLAGLLFLVGLFLNRSDPSSETGPVETFAYWHADHGRHQIVGLLVAPLIAFLLLFFGAGLKRHLERGGFRPRIRGFRRRDARSSRLRPRRDARGRDGERRP